MNNNVRILKQYEVYLDFQEFKKICERIASGKMEKIPRTIKEIVY